MTLKELRVSRKLTQEEVAADLGISLRSYITYENDPKKEKTIKYKYFMSEIEKYNKIDEENGILSIDDIMKACSDVFDSFKVDYCILFGSYAKNNPNEKSDVDLLVSTTETGLKYYEMVELLRERLSKKVDVLDLKQVVGNEKLLDEVLRCGVRIYG